MLTAVSRTIFGVGTTGGAVYVTLPSALPTIVPIAAFPPAIPLISQLTPILFVPVIVRPILMLLLTRTLVPADVCAVSTTFPGPTDSETGAELAEPGSGLLIMSG